jgi:hypothetical protein
VVATEEVAVVGLAVVIEVDVTIAVVLLAPGVVVLVVVDVEQDVKTIDAIMRQVNAIQITPLFIQTSFYFSKEYSK